MTTANTTKSPRTCPVCLTVFTPKRIDMMFCQRTCTNGLYMREDAAYVEFAKALLRQIFACFLCGKTTDTTRLRPLLLKPADPGSAVVAACVPCKQTHYRSGQCL